MEKITKFEKFVLNRYAVSELAGGLYLGKWSRKSSDPYLKAMLAWHCAEEARHAVVWNNLLQELNIELEEIHDNGGESFFSQEENAEDVIDFLAITHVFELRVPSHLRAHARWTKSEEVKRVCEKLIPEEGPHLRWIGEVLKKEATKNPKVEKALLKYLEIEKKSYEDDLKNLEKIFGSDAKEYCEIMSQEAKRHEPKMFVAIKNIFSEK